jgi:uncharacterized protein
MVKHQGWSACTEIQVSKDRLHAFLSFRNESEDFMQGTLQDLENWLTTNQIVFGWNRPVLESIASNPKAYLGQTVEVASGIPPQPGKDAELQFFFSDEGAIRPKVLPDGRVDFFHVTTIRNVTAGTLLVTKQPMQLGTDGLDVFGHPIKARIPRDVRLPVGKNVTVSDDGLSLYANIDGHVVYIAADHQVHVLPSYTVSGDVDFSVGNIECIGNVKVMGNVLDGFRIHAEGDIEVKGNIGAADLFAKGNIFVHGGIQTRGKGTIQCGGTVRTKYIQNSIVRAGCDVLVQDSIMHSDVSANRSVRVEGKKAVIVGGITRAGETVHTKHLGSPMATPTEVEVGVRPDLRDALAKIDQKHKELADTREKSKKAMELLDNLVKQGKVLPPDKAQLRGNLEKTLLSVEHEMEQLSLRRLEIEAEIAQTNLATIVAEEQVNPGVRVVIRQQIAYVRDPKKRVVFRIEAGEIGCYPYM